MTEASSPPCLSTEDLGHLADWLRTQNFRPATQQCVWAQHLLVRLALEGRLPADPRGLASHLGPIFCSTPEQQHCFSEVFGQWLAIRFALPPGVAVDGSQPARARTHRRRPRRWVIGGIVVAGMLILIGWLGKIWIIEPNAGAVVGEIVSRAVQISDPSPSALPVKSSESLDIVLLRTIQWPKAPTPYDWPRTLATAAPLVLYGGWLAWSRWRHRAEPATSRQSDAAPFEGDPF